MKPCKGLKACLKPPHTSLICLSFSGQFFLPSSLNAHLFIYFIIMLFVIHVLITLTKSGAVCYGCVSDGNAIIFIAFFIYHRILKKKLSFLHLLCYGYISI